MQKWKELADRQDRVSKEVSIALVGKYTQLEDSYASVIKALQHASLACNHKMKILYIEGEDLEESIKEKDPIRFHEAWQQLCKSNGILVPGGFGTRGTEGKIAAAEWARKNKKPYLGVCLGLQCAVVEFARNVLGWSTAASTEVDPNTDSPVIIEMPEHNPGDMGGTMRLGKRQTVFKATNSVLYALYGNAERIEERHRHRYEVNPKYIPDFEAAGLKFVGHDVDGQRMEIVELEGHPYYVGVQYHPEYISRPLKPSPPYLGLVLASLGKLQSYLARGCRMSPRNLSEGSSDEEEPQTVIIERRCDPPVG